MINLNIIERKHRFFRQSNGLHPNYLISENFKLKKSLRRDMRNENEENKSAEAAGTSSTSAMATMTEASAVSVEERMKLRQILKVPVLENVADYLAKKKASLEDVQEDERENFRRYKYLETNALLQKAKIEESIQDYQKSLEALKMLAEQKGKGAESIEITYKLDENLYSQAVVEKMDRLSIWLGANVMVEYELGEAQTLLATHLENIQRTNKETEEELNFLRDQITTTEVNLANLFNYGVQNRKRSEAAASTTTNSVH